MTTDDNPYAALEALEVKARTSRNHRTTHPLGFGRSLEVEQDGAVREPHYRGGAVFEFFYRYEDADGRQRLLARVEAQDLLDGYEPEPPAPATPVEHLAAPKGLQQMLARPVTYTTPAPVIVDGDRSVTAQAEARAAALATLADPEWWDARARHTGEAWLVSFERRIRRRE